MHIDKFQNEIENLEIFFSLYCKENHKDAEIRFYELEYKGQIYNQEIYLCEECDTLLKYAHKRVMACPHEAKPKCRTCQVPCYEKKEWKALAKVMRYSAIRLKLGRFASYIIDKFK